MGTIYITLTEGTTLAAQWCESCVTNMATAEIFRHNFPADKNNSLQFPHCPSILFNFNFSNPFKLSWKNCKCSGREPTDNRLGNIGFGNNSNDDTNNDDFRRRSKKGRKSLS